MSGGGGQTTSTSVNYSPEEAARRTQVMDEAARIYGNSKDTLTNSEYPGAKVVPFSADTKLGQSQLRTYANTGAQTLADQTAAATQFGLKDVLNPASNEALQGSIDAAVRPLTEAYSDAGGALSQIRNSAVGNGTFGGSRQGVAEGIATGKYLNAVEDTAAKMASENYQAGLNTFAKTLALAPQTQQMGQQPALLNATLGAQEEAQLAAQEDYASQAKMWGLNSEWLPLQNYANIVYGGASPGTTSQMSGAKANPLMAGAGGAMAGYSLATMMPALGMTGPVGAGVGLAAALLMS